MWCVYHASLWIVFLTPPSFLWQQGGLHDIMKNRTRKENKNDWILFGKMAISLVVFFKTIPFPTPIPFSSYKMFWSEKKWWWWQGKWQSLWGTSRLGTSLCVNCFLLTFFFIAFCVSCVLGDAHATELTWKSEHNLWGYYSSSKTDPRLSGLLTRPFNS